MNQRNESLGFTEQVLAEASQFESYYVGRIISQKQKLYEIALLEGTIHGEVTGKMRYEAMDPADFPVVGDFVMVDRKDETHGYAVIHEILTGIAPESPYRACRLQPWDERRLRGKIYRSLNLIPIQCVYEPNI